MQDTRLLSAENLHIIPLLAMSVYVYLKADEGRVKAV
jgi:hypothetical protein